MQKNIVFTAAQRLSLRRQKSTKLNRHFPKLVNRKKLFFTTHTDFLKVKKKEKLRIVLLGILVEGSYCVHNYTKASTEANAKLNRDFPERVRRKKSFFILYTDF